MYKMSFLIGAIPRTNAAFGPGVGGIVLDSVRCIGLEVSLLECAHTPFELVSCRHYQDAGVTCIAGRFLYFNVYTT